MTHDPIVRIKHVREAKLCLKGVRAWAQRYGLSYGEFVENGMRASVLEATRDPLALRAVEMARKDPEA